MLEKGDLFYMGTDEHKYSEAMAKCVLICEWLEDYKRLKNEGH